MWLKMSECCAVNISTAQSVKLIEGELAFYWAHPPIDMEFEGLSMDWDSSIYVEDDFILLVPVNHPQYTLLRKQVGL